MKSPFKKSHLSHLKMYIHTHTYKETSIAMILKYGVALSPTSDFLFDNKLETLRRIIFIFYIPVTATITMVVILIFSYIVERRARYSPLWSSPQKERVFMWHLLYTKHYSLWFPYINSFNPNTNCMR